MGGEYKGKRNRHCVMHVTLLTRCFTRRSSCDSTNCGNSSNNDDNAASLAAKMTMPMMPAASMLQGMPFFSKLFSHSTISVLRSGFSYFWYSSTTGQNIFLREDPPIIFHFLSTFKICKYLDNGCPKSFHCREDPSAFCNISPIYLRFLGFFLNL